MYSVVLLPVPFGPPSSLDPTSETLVCPLYRVKPTFGFAVLIAVYAFGHVSGAHINPTVTMGLAVVGKLPWRAVPAYIFAQFAGAILASLALWLIFGEEANDAPLLLGATAPGPLGVWPAFVMEVILGFLLVVVLLATLTDERAISAGSGLAMGFTVGIGVAVALRVLGGSLNAARSLGPMIVSAQYPSAWVYIIAPTIGGVLGALCYGYLTRKGAPPG